MARMSIRSIRYRRPKNPTWDLDLERAITLDPDQPDGAWDLPALFGRDAPVHVEIGFGKGRFILAAAEQWPDYNWLGIEYVQPCVSLVAERAARAELTNIRIIRCPAEDVVAEHLTEGSIHSYHIYFPDPWPKKRHHKRRLVKTPFVSEIRRTLIPGGELHVATDYAEYFEEMIPAIEAAALTRADDADSDVWRTASTNFEDKAIERGSDIHHALFRKLS